MHTIWEFIKRDARHIFLNVISLVVCIGMTIVPCLYAWFNIYGSWDPYSNTGNIRVALATDDKGYSSDLVPISVNIGNEIVSELSESDAIGYEVTNSTEAQEGVRSGKYYAAIVIPKNFTRNMLTSFTDGGDGAEVIFYTNEKRNAIASIVTDKASTSAQAKIDETFSSALVQVGSSILSEVGSYLDSDEVQTFATKLQGALTTAQDNLGTTASTIRNYQSLVQGAKALVGGSSQNSLASLSATLDAGDTLRQTASGVRSLFSALNNSKSALADTLDSSAKSLDGVSSAIDNAYSVANTQLDDGVSALIQAKQQVDARSSELKAIRDNLSGDTATLLNRVTSFERQIGTANVNYQRVHQVRLTIEGLNDGLTQAIDQLDDLSSQLQGTIDDLNRSASDTSAGKEELARMVANAQAKLKEVSDNYDSNLASTLPTLASSIDELANSSDDISSKISSTVSSVSHVADDTANNLDELQASLGTTAQKVDNAASKLHDLDTNLAQALASGDIDQIRSVLSANATDLAAFISQPTTMDRTAIYPVENTGSAMAPFYTTLAIWIGAVILCALVKVAPSEACIEELHPKPWQSYFGRLTFFAIMAFLQSTLIMLGDLFFLGIQCEHPGLFLLCGWVASFVFVNLVFSLTASFGDVGKAIAVLLMVIQVAGSGGTFPREMLPTFFQNIYPWLPFVHAEDAFRSAIAGLYQNDFWVSLGTLAAFLVPAFLLGLVLRKPVIRVNEWFEHKLEQTHVM